MFVINEEDDEILLIKSVKILLLFYFTLIDFHDLAEWIRSFKVD